MWRFLCFVGRFSSFCVCCEWALLLWLHADKTLELGQNSLLFFFLPFDANGGIGSTLRLPHSCLFLFTRPHLRSLRLLIISFYITCQMTRVYLLCDLQQNASYSALSCCHCTVLWYIFVSSLHMSLYPGYSGLQDPKSSFYKSSGSSEEVW